MSHYIIDQSAYPALQGEGGGHNIVVRPSDEAVIAVYCSDITGYNQVYLQTSLDGGETWSGRELINPAANSTDDHREPSVAMDLNEDLHIAYRGNGRNGSNYDILYRKYVKGVGLDSEEEVCHKSGYHQYYPAIAIDIYDYPHIVWHGTGHGGYADKNQVCHCSKGATGWNSVELLTEMDYHQRCPSIDGDADGEMHIVWYGYGWGGYPSNSQILYHRTVEGVVPPVPSIEQVTNDELNNHSPRIAIDRDNFPHIIFAYGAIVCYGNKRTGAWEGNVVNVFEFYGAGYPQIAINPLNDVFCVYYGEPENGHGKETYCRVMLSTGKWLDEEKIFDADEFDGTDVNIAHARIPSVQMQISFTIHLLQDGYRNRSYAKPYVVYTPYVPMGNLSGTIWVESTRLHYIDGVGTERSYEGELV